MDKRFSWFRQAPAFRQQGIRRFLRSLHFPSPADWDLARVKEEIFHRLNRADIQAIATLFLAITAVMLMTNFMVRLQSRTVFGPNFGADFATFYNAGKIFNSQPPEKIYDAGLQRRLSADLFPDNRVEHNYLPYSQAPFLIGIFSLLARLDYTLAYLIWIVLSGGLYFIGFHFLWGTLKSMPRVNYGTGLLLAASFMPFIVECLAGGQTSAIGFFGLAAAIAFERRGSLRLSGFVLSLLCYQPALLILVLPMLIFTRRTRTLSGFLMGSALWGGLSGLLMGRAGCVEYGRTLLLYVTHSIGETNEFRLWKYVDFNTSLRLLFGDQGAWTLILSAGLFLAVLFMLIGFWWRAERRSRNYQSLLWSAAITWTLTTGLFVGIYDATLLVVSLMLTAHFFYSRADEGGEPLAPELRLLMVCVYLIPWITQPAAKLLGIQLYTPVLVCLGWYQFRLLRRAKLLPAKPALQTAGEGSLSENIDEW